MVEHHALGWALEFLYTDYAIVADSASSLSSRGPIALEQVNPEAKAGFSSIEIKELPKTQADPTPSPSRTASLSPELPRVEEKTPEAPPALTADGFRILFNGKDLQGWKRHPAGNGEWTVENGTLVGRGPDQSHLFSERADYTHFHARIEANINAGGNSGLCFRTAFFGKGRLEGNGYEASIDNSSAGWRTGSLMHFGTSGSVSRLLVKPGEWLLLEVIALGNRILIKVNGKTTIDFIDMNQTYSRGHLALQQLGARTEARFRRIDLKELPLGTTLKDLEEGTRPRFTGAKEFKGKSYLAVREELSWREARQRCLEMGGHLAVVTDEPRNSFLTALLRSQGVNAAWLGATDELIEGQWVWVDSSPMLYRNWDQVGRQPNNKQGLEHYLVLLVRNGGKWCDQPNSLNLEHPGFVCQWD